ncbi:MAG: hypothetical protein BWX88_01706 [Planctomycetes bacterium ADurb.Bin126]|nr:MAG: hypothetical protein BWX88_01706 [Planctomycetes bacterium ADurb.Bin126]HOD83299.1 hypothetical protein [Phycisphaerae bacterium]HQL73175.1 hypothetical protein [Phycisphaerae bacterium]
MKSKQMTLRDLLVTLVALFIGLCLIVAILLPSFGRAGPLVKRAMCGANLCGLGKALAHYRDENRGSFPWAVDASTYSFSNTAPMRLGGYDGVWRAGQEDLGQAASAPQTPPAPVVLMSKDGRDNLHILENLCVLVERRMVGWNAFRCPTVGGDTMRRDRFGNREYGFYGKSSARDTGTYFNDYAMHWGYDNKDAAEPNAAPLNDRTESELIILADRHGRSLREFSTVDPAGDNDGDGYNHDTNGVTALTAEGRVYWKENLRSGWGGNNIYLRDLKADDTLNPAATTQGIPLSKYDSVLVNPEPMR